MNATSGSSPTSPRRVLITGRAAVMPIGEDLETIRAALFAEPASHAADAFPVSDAAAYLGHLANWEPESLDRRTRTQMCDAAQYALVATQKALADAGVDIDQSDRNRIATLIGTMMAGLPEVVRIHGFLEKGKKSRAGGLGTTKLMNSASTVAVSAALGLRGPSLSVSSALATGLDNIGLGFEMIRSGEVDIAICGATEEDSSEVLGPFIRHWDEEFGYDSSSSPRVPRPFDSSRTGPVMSVGSSIVVLESEESVSRRAATPLAEIVSYDAGFSGKATGETDANHSEDQFGEALERAILSVLEQAPESMRAQIDHVLCGAAGFRQADSIHATTLSKTVGADCPVTSLRGLTGLPLGTGSAFDVLAAIEMQQAGKLAATFGLNDPAEDCRSIRHVRRPETRELRTSLVTAGGFGFGSAMLLLATR